MPQSTNYVDFAGAVPARPRRHVELDGGRYTSAIFMRREWEAIWTKSWLLAGLELDLEESGDYFVFEIGPESIIVARTEDRKLAAYFNVCQHRGNRIVTNERGTSGSISCPYHGWTYGLDGKLKQVPDEDRFSKGLPGDQLSLKEVKVEAWAGLVWINMDPEAGPLADFLGLVIPQLTPFHFENMVLIQDQTVCLDTNWKTAVDNFNEQYHVDFIHPQHASFVDCCNAVNELWPYGHRRVLVEGYVTNPRYGTPEEVPPILAAQIKPLGLDPDDFRGKVADVRPAVQRAKRELGLSLGFDVSGFTDDQLSDVLQYDLFPNVIMTIRPETLWVMRPRPHPTDPNKCFFDKWSLRIDVPDDTERGLSLVFNRGQKPSGSERPEREVFTRDDVVAGRNSMTITIDQDIHYLNDMQAGLRSRGFTRAWLNDDEARVQHFHDWVDIWMAGSPIRADQKLARAAE
jgi:phenylpropionate dioxygenase-like ring-hydroxylating dioxygenase large terminal subunit